MARTWRAVDILTQLKPAARARLAVAVFLMFGILGPLAVLIESNIRVFPWSFVIIQTVASGGLAASIVLLLGKRWWTYLLIIAFWMGVLTMNSGGLIFTSDEEGFRVRLEGFDRRRNQARSDQQLVLQPSDLDAIYTQRGLLGLLDIALLATGYAMFIRLMRDEVQQRARLQTEVKIAQDIQLSLMPSSTFQNSWCEVAGITIPASEVGGDFFDIVEISEHQIAVAVADVTGHGVGAGILSAMTKSALHSQLQHDPSPVSVLTNLNKTIYEVSDDRMFVTFAYLLLDKSTNTAHMATAGHPPMFIKQFKAASIDERRTVSLALGIQRQAQFSGASERFADGAMFLLYTDGVLEAANTHDEQFAIDRLRKVFLAANDSAQAANRSIVSELTTFAGSAIFPDDVTLVCVKL